jgi:hypothetical protein
MESTAQTRPSGLPRNFAKRARNDARRERTSPLVVFGEPANLKSLKRLMQYAAFAACCLCYQQAHSQTATALAADSGSPSLAASGAAGDGRTDDTTAINAFLTKFTRGGLVRVPAGKFYLINSGQLVVPTNVKVSGSSSPFSSPGAAPIETSGGFLLNPAYTITLQQGAQLANLAILRTGLVTHPTASQAMSAVAQWGSERSVGVTLPQNVGGQTLRDLFIEGFNTCIKAKVGGFSIQRVAGDCYNGVDVSAGGDNYYIDDVRIEPYYSLKTPASSGAWARAGIAFNLHDGDTGSVLTRVFSFMWANGLVFNDTGVAQVANSGFEWQSSFGNGIAGTKGVRWINHNSETSINNVYVNGFNTSVSDEGVGEVLMHAPSVGSASITGFNLGGTTATPTTITVAGKVDAGNTISATLTSQGISTSPITVTYTAVSGDIDATVAQELAQRIDALQPLIAAGVFAGVHADVVTVYWPQTISVSVTAHASGGIAAAIGTAPAMPGSYGSVVAADVTGAPAFSIGPGVSHWNIADPFMGNANLPPGWLVVHPTSLDRIRLIGIPWSGPIGPGNLSSCGKNPSMTPHSTDVRGGIVEGEGATGCTLRFITPFVSSPTCVVSSPNGAALTGYNTSTTELIIANPRLAGARYTYICAP